MLDWVLGRKCQIDLIGVNAGECVFYSPPARVVVIDPMIQNLISDDELKELTRDIAQAVNIKVAVPVYS